MIIQDIHCNIYDRIRTEEVIHSLKETVEKYGKPRKILVDNDKRLRKNLKNGARKKA